MQIEALKRTWEWPEADTKCRAVSFDWSSDLQQVYRHVSKFDVVIQAGGNMGVWPWVMAKTFGQVHSFEADPSIYPYLMKNTEGVKNITATLAALWDTNDETVSMKYETPDNLGAQYIKFAPGEVKTLKIDTFMRWHKSVDACDLIYLDIEGAEMGALRGAVETIQKFKPTIVVEDKGLSLRYGTARGDIGKWLAQEFGYEHAAKVHRDVIYTCK